MTKIESYRAILQALPAAEWAAYLQCESGLPGPRGNLELSHAAGDLIDPVLIEAYLRFDAQRAPTNTPGEFLAFCGVLGLGRLLAEGQPEALARLRAAAGDPRWRTREAVAQALQRWGDETMDQLLAAMSDWAGGSPLEMRAAAAAICEPRLLSRPVHAEATLRILDTITAHMEESSERRSEEFQALRKGMGYCWSVAVAAHPELGKPAMERWFGCQDRDIQWVMRENLRKARLARADPSWVAHWTTVLESHQTATPTP